MPSTGTILDSTIISMRPTDMNQATRQGSPGVTTTFSNPPDEREIFKALHDCMKDVGKFRQYIYYLGTSCDTTKLRNKIQKLKERINHSFYHQRELIRRGALSTGSMKNETTIHRFEKFLCFTLASLNYYEDLLHKFSILLAYFPLATGEIADSTSVVRLGFEDSTINTDEISYENQENEENETNRYIELLNQIQCLQTIRDEIEQIDIYQLRHHATSYSKEFVENMHKYTNELISETNNERNRYSLRYNFAEHSISPISRCNRREILCILSVLLLIVIIIGIVVGVITATKRATIGK